MIRRADSQAPVRGKPMFMRVSCDYCDREPLPLERTEGWANVIGYDLNVCPDCQQRPFGLELRPLSVASVVERLERHDMLPKGWRVV